MINQESRNGYSRKKRGVAQLNATLDKHLLAYAAAASAAGVSLLVLAQPTEAKIVYTPTNVEIAPTSKTGIDLIHNGKSDFLLSNHTSTPSTGSIFINELKVVPRGQNGVQGYASVLRSGVLVGPKSKFQTSTQKMAEFTRYCPRESSYCTTEATGNWKNITRGYMGLKFFIHGKAHYGWARLNVTIADNGVYALLTGYAYETIANKAILTGKTKGNEDKRSENEGQAGGVGKVNPAVLGKRKSEPAGLGLLAQGAAGLDVWRKRDPDSPVIETVGWWRW
jgi:hypothetical protein